MSLWHSDRVSVSHTGDSGFEFSNLFKIILFLSLNSVISVKTFRENSNILFCPICPRGLPSEKQNTSAVFSSCYDQM